MTIENLLKAIQACDNGQVAFNQGEIRSFLYGNKWYPLRAVLNEASVFANGPKDLTTDQGLVALVYLGVWTRVEDVSFTNNLPVPVNNDIRNREINRLIDVLYKLSK